MEEGFERPLLDLELTNYLDLEVVNHRIDIGLQLLELLAQLLVDVGLYLLGARSAALDLVVEVLGLEILAELTALVVVDFHFEVIIKFTARLILVILKWLFILPLHPFFFLNILVHLPDIRGKRSITALLTLTDTGPHIPFCLLADLLDGFEVALLLGLVLPLTHGILVACLLLLAHCGTDL